MSHTLGAAAIGKIAMITVQAARIGFVSAALASAVVAASTVNAGTEQVLYAFHGFPLRDGANPQAVPTMDGNGDLYGTASAGGASGCGMAYKLHKRQDGTWKETALYNFSCGGDGNG